MPVTSVKLAVPSTSVKLAVPVTSVKLAVPVTSVKLAVPVTLVKLEEPSTVVKLAVPSTSVKMIIKYQAGHHGQNLIQASRGNGEATLKVSARSLENSRRGNEYSSGHLNGSLQVALKVIGSLPKFDTS